jgi:hypothetical protein
MINQYMNKKIIVLLFVIPIILAACEKVNVCGNTKCEWEGNYKETHSSCSSDCKSCDDKNICTEDNYDYATDKCSHTELINCCGNDKCESSETPLTCNKDCRVDLEISSIQVRVNKADKGFERAKYVEGEIFKQDELISGSNIGYIYAFLRNSGNTYIEDLYATYTCEDETYDIHSKNICYTIPQVMDKSTCYHTFSGSEEGIIFEGDDTSSTKVIHLPSQAHLGFGVYLSPMSNLEYFRKNPDPDMFHRLSCKITFLSDKSGIKKSFEIKNYRLRPDLSNFIPQSGIKR